jgi:hypothetical protein
LARVGSLRVAAATLRCWNSHATKPSEAAFLSNRLRKRSAASSTIRGKRRQDADMDAVAWTGLAMLLAANALATRKAWRCRRLRPGVRGALIAGVWLLPVFGAVWALLATELPAVPARMRVRIVAGSHGARRGPAGEGAAFWAHVGATVDSGGSGGSYCGSDSSGGCHGGGDGGSGGDCGGGGGDGGGGGCH